MWYCLAAIAAITVACTVRAAPARRETPDEVSDNYLVNLTYPISDEDRDEEILAAAGLKPCRNGTGDNARGIGWVVDGFERAQALRKRLLELGDTYVSIREQ
jgi:hypothetical protein